MESIKKWEQIVSGEMPDMGGENCPLCMEFADSIFEMCKGCPVEQKTGEKGCVDTPYMEWLDASDEYPFVADTPRLIALAQKELDFLRSLARSS